MKQFDAQSSLQRSTPNAAGPLSREIPSVNVSTAGDEEDRGKNLFVDYYRTFARHRRLILLLAGIGLVAATLMHLTTQPVYRTRTSLDIQSLNGDFMNVRAVDPTIGGTSNDTNLETQIKLLQSDSLMERVQQRLTAEPHPEFVQRNDLLSRAARLVHLDRTDGIPYQALLDETVKGVTVKPLGITRLIEVRCDSWDPTFAAKFCNTLTSEFQEEDLENRGTEAKHTSDWLMHQASDIRQKAEESEQRLFAATGGNGLILSQESNSVGEDRLRQLQAELVKAQADRMEKEAQTTVARTASPDSTPNIVDDPAYAASRAKLGDLKNEVAALVPPLTEANPKIIHLRSQIKQIEDNMATQRIDSGQQLQNEYTAAKHREDLLTLAYRTQEAGVSTDLEKGSQVSLLRREVESEQQLYQTLLQRAKEAGFASAMQASTIRVVDAARKPKLAVYPQRITAGIIGLLLGSIIGVIIAFFKDRNTEVFRLPGQSERLLQIDELGVIPSSPNIGAGLRTSSKTILGDSLKLSSGDRHGALETARWDDKFSLVAEAYRNATLSLMLTGRGKQSRIYVVSSPSCGEGKSTVVSNLGVALSKAKLRVALVDGDLRKPNLHRAMSVSNTFGLRNILRGEFDFRSSSLSSFCLPTAFPELYVIPAGQGSEEVVELLHSSKLSDLIDRLAKDFDVVLIDTPPMLHMADARIFAGYADGAILILRSGITTRAQAITARDLFDHDRVQVIGTVLNDFNPAKEGQSNYYKSYYAYQQESESKRSLAVRS
jgi:succinoglycan biosynthesis transport protein ExoP